MTGSRNALATVASVSLIVGLARPVEAVVTCSLPTPDKTIRQLFPESTGHRLQIKRMKMSGGIELRDKIAHALGRPLDQAGEYDVMYPVYEVLVEDKLISRIMCSTERGQGHKCQIAVAISTQGKLQKLFFDSLLYPPPEVFHSPEYTARFQGLGLLDFKEQGQAEAIEAPPGGTPFDNQAIKQGVHKLLLLHEAWFRSQPRRGK